MFKQHVFARFQFEGFHRWPNAPDEVAFLRDRHRHLFHVEARAPVHHDDRDREFILMKRELEQWCVARSFEEVRSVIAPRGGDEWKVQTWSCERWAIELLTAFPFLSSVSVSEDGENGAHVERISSDG